MHNFDLTAFINKNPDDNKLLIQLTFIDSMAYSQFGQNVNEAYARRCLKKHKIEAENKSKTRLKLEKTR